MSIFKKGEIKLLWNFYIYLLFWTFSLMIQPYMFIYFRELGFSFTQIASFTSVMMLSLFIFEVPTGIVADLYGRKKSVFIGLIITGVAPIIISFSHNYFIILICYAIMGLGITFISGAEEALIVDNLKFHKRDDLINEYYVKMASFMGLGTVAAYLIGSAIVKYWDIKPLWIIWGVGYLSSAILLIFIKEYGFKPIEKHASYFKTVISPVKSSINYIRNNRNFLNYLVGSSLITILFVQNDLWNVFLVNIGINKSFLSLIASITSLVVVVLPWLSKKVKNIKIALLITTIIKVLILLSSIFINKGNVYLGVILFIILGSIYSFESPLTSTYVQKQVKSENRATMGSLMSMIYSVLGAIAGIGVGLTSDIIGVKLTIALFSIFGFISLYFFSKMTYINNKDNHSEN